MKAAERRILTTSGVAALAIIIVLFLLRHFRRRNSPVITANTVEIATVTPITSSSTLSYPTLPTTSSFTFQYNPSALQNAQTLIEDIDVDGIVFGRHYDIRVIAPTWNNYGGISIQLSPVADNLIRIVIINETNERVDLPELTISVLKFN